MRIAYEIVIAEVSKSFACGNLQPIGSKKSRTARSSIHLKAFVLLEDKTKAVFCVEKQPWRYVQARLGLGFSGE